MPLPERAGHDLNASIYLRIEKASPVVWLMGQSYTKLL
jgi:hypothetical protein